MTRLVIERIIVILVLVSALGGLHCGPRGGNVYQTVGGKKTPKQGQSTKARTTCEKIKALQLPAPLGSTKELEKRFLAAHNEIRRLHNLSDLSWDSSLAAYAERWAQYLKTNNRCQMQHRSKANVTEGKKYGENLAFNWISTRIPLGAFNNAPEGVVKSWSKECEDYSYQQNSCTSNKMCGHYTQVIWHNTARVGCGMVVCDGEENSYGRGRTELWVCNYDPPGNYIGEWPY